MLKDLLLEVCVGSYLKKQSSSKCVTVTDLKRDDSTLILDDEQDAWLMVRYKIANSLSGQVLYIAQINLIFK